MYNCMLMFAAVFVGQCSLLLIKNNVSMVDFVAKSEFHTCGAKHGFIRPAPRQRP